MDKDEGRWRVLLHSEHLSDFLVEFFGMTTGPSAREVTVLAYHAVRDLAGAPVLASYGVPPERLRRQLAGLRRLGFRFATPDEVVRLVRDGRPAVENLFPRCVSREGNLRAQEQLWSVFKPIGGRWRGIAHVPNGNLRLRDEWAHLDARRRFRIDLTALWDEAPSALAQSCICGDIMAGIQSPADCRLFGKECVPESPVGACMVSSEGTCRIWHQYGTTPQLAAAVGIRAGK